MNTTIEMSMRRAFAELVNAEPDLQKRICAVNNLQGWVTLSALRDLLEIIDTNRQACIEVLDRVAKGEDGAVELAGQVRDRLFDQHRQANHGDGQYVPAMPPVAAAVPPIPVDVHVVTYDRRDVHGVDLPVSEFRQVSTGKRMGHEFTRIWQSRATEFPPAS